MGRHEIPSKAWFAEKERLESFREQRMTYWGAPSPGGEKFYKGSSSDSAWNHDLLWKVRVEKEVTTMGPEEEVVPAIDYNAGVMDRTWKPAEIEMLKAAVREFGAGNFGPILNDPRYMALRNHSETALREKWRHLENRRMKSQSSIKAVWKN